jgi:hypothetical protein
MDQIEELAEVWNAAASVLGVHLSAPYVLSSSNGSVKCAAFLPHFGSTRGMVVGVTSEPDFAIDPNLVECARTEGLYLSFIDTSVYATRGIESFKDALRDWGYFGPAESRPEWMGVQLRTN